MPPYPVVLREARMPPHPFCAKGPFVFIAYATHQLKTCPVNDRPMMPRVICGEIGALDGEALAAFLQPLTDPGMDIGHRSVCRFREPVFDGSPLIPSGRRQSLTG